MTVKLRTVEHLFVYLQGCLFSHIVIHRYCSVEAEEYYAPVANTVVIFKYDQM